MYLRGQSHYQTLTEQTLWNLDMKQLGLWLKHDGWNYNTNLYSVLPYFKVLATTGHEGPQGH